MTRDIGPSSPALACEMALQQLRLAVAELKAVPAYVHDAVMAPDADGLPRRVDTLIGDAALDLLGLAHAIEEHRCARVTLLRGGA